MTLRSRIRLGLVIIMVLLIGLAVAVVFRQRDQMISQLDAQLESAAPLNRARPLDRGELPPPASPEFGDPSEQPISDIFIASIALDGTVDVAIQGQLLETTPDLSEISVSGGRQIETVHAVDGSTRFRVLAELDDQGVVRVIALSMTDVDDTTRQLVVAFLVVGALILGTLIAMAYAILRLGLRPISEVTSAAQAIKAGERDRRAPELPPTTEAGQLAESFNLMLDQRDAAEDKLRQFVSDASHELRTPLTSIRGYLDLYAAGAFAEPEQLDDVVRRMTDESTRMSGLVETLLQLARLDEQGGLELVPTDLRTIIDDVISNSRAAHPDREIEALTSMDNIVVPIDAPKIQQLLGGLVDNAVTHGPDASVRIHVEPLGHEVKIVVADNGPGMSSDDANSAFDRFYRGDRSRARTRGGSGLGLAIAKAIAEAHSGSIDLATAPGEGCRFTVTLPR